MHRHKHICTAYRECMTQVFVPTTTRQCWGLFCSSLEVLHALCNHVSYAVIYIPPRRPTFDSIDTPNSATTSSRSHTNHRHSSFTVQSQMPCGLCMHVCMYVCMHACMYVYMHVCIGLGIGNSRDKCIAGVRRENLFHYTLGVAFLLLALE